MPIDDALLLAARNFEAYMRGETLVPEDPNRMNLADRHPMPIQVNNLFLKTEGRCNYYYRPKESHIGTCRVNSWFGLFFL